jgi:hypothetical protein
MSEKPELEIKFYKEGLWKGAEIERDRIHEIVEEAFCKDISKKDTLIEIIRGIWKPKRNEEKVTEDWKEEK